MNSTTNDKIRTLLELEDISKSAREKNLRVVHCHGVFDLLHPGHVLHLQEARKFGNLLVVTITSDKYVNKGPGRPRLKQDDRAAMLAALADVDFVGISDNETAIQAIRSLPGSIYVKGPDYKDVSSDITGNMAREIDEVLSHGGEVRTTISSTMSSSRISNQLLMGNDNEFGDWLADFRKHHTEEDVNELFKSIAQLSVLVIGEVIIDEYQTCEALGKSSKDPVLAFKKLNFEKHAGGSLAVARHAAGLGAKVTVLSRIGNSTNDLDWIEASMPENVKLRLQVSQTEPTITKTRYVDSLTKNKVFETYEIGEDEASSEDDENFLKALEELVDSFDIILVADYGHGLISKKHREIISRSRSVKAINTQSNAGNRGFNAISKYPAADVICLNGSEVSVELRRRHLDLPLLVPELASKMQSKFTAITNGARGLYFEDKRGLNPGTVKAPAFPTDIQDRVGAGDALFVAAALSWAAGNSGMLSATLGNLAGAAIVQELGNRSAINGVSLQRHLLALLK